MGRTPDKDPTQTGDTPAPRPGRVEVDARGRNVWRWNRQEGDSTSVLLQRLDNKDLALEPTQKVPVVRKAVVPAAGKPGAAAPSRRSNATAPGAAARTPASSASTTSKAAAKPAQKAKPPFGLERSKGDKGGGFDPYNSR